MSKIKRKLGLRLVELRSEAGLTQAKLAAKADVSIDLISRIERGDRAPSLETLERLSMALKVSPAQLLNFDGEEFSALSETPQEAIQLWKLLKGKKSKQIKKVYSVAKIILE